MHPALNFTKQPEPNWPFNNKQIPTKTFVNHQELVPSKKVQKNHWHLLHEYKLVPWNPKKAKNDYLRWKQKIPNSRTCPCKKNWAILDKANPPDFTSPDSFFFWGVDRHNDINAELGKPILTHEEADMIHRSQLRSTM